MINSIKNSSRHNYFIVLLCLYLYLHSPFIPFLPFAIGSAKLLYIPMLLTLISHTNSFRCFRRTFKAEFVILLLVISFVVVRTIGGGENLLSFYISSIIEIFFLPWFIIHLLINNGFRRIEDLVHVLLLVGTIGAFISTIAFLIPSVNDFIRDHFLYLKTGIGLDTKTWRGFGLSSTLTSHYSFIQASIVVFFLYYPKNRWFVFVLPFMLLSIIFNARTGLIILIFGIIIRYIYHFNIKGILFVSLLLVFVVRNLDNFFSIIGASNESVMWVQSFFEEIEFLSGDSGLQERGVLYTLYEEMIIWPSNMEEWIWGKGFSLFGKIDELGFDSDIGFINVLAYGGIIYSVILYSLIIVVCRKLTRYKEYWFMAFYIIIFVIINIKSTYLPLSGQLRFMMLIYYFLILQDKSRKKGTPILSFYYK